MQRLVGMRPICNARRHSRTQIKQIAKSIETFGFANPILVTDDLEILAGHGRAAAARLLDMTRAPIVRLSNLSPAERKAYVLADNKLALNAGWDRELLAIELQGLIDLGFDVETTGFTLGEIEVVLEEAADSATHHPSDGLDDETPAVRDVAVTRRGDVWQAGRHRLICGDARDTTAYEALLNDEMADLIFTDPPYNVPIDGHVCGLGRVRHREFAMGVGEMSSTEFTVFLKQTLGPAAEQCRDGAIAFVCMDSRHMEELLACLADGRARPAGGAERQVAKLVEDDEIGVSEPGRDLARFALKLLLLKNVDEFDRGEDLPHAIDRNGDLLDCMRMSAVGKFLA